MASEYPSGQMKRSSPCLDRLSNLPEEVINYILTFVPIRDVVRTSVLSWGWRYKWMTIREIFITDNSIISLITSDENGTGHGKTLVDFVNHVMLLHDGELDKFNMYIHLESSFNDVDRWILLLARKSVKEAVLAFTGDRYNMPSSLFSCQSLRQLKLLGCILKSSSRMKGLNSLVELELYGVTVTNETIASLIANSKQLQMLTLVYCSGFDRLYICAPNLIYFYIHDHYCGDIHFDNSPKLENASMGLLPIATSFGYLPINHCWTSTHKLEFFLAGLHRVETLFISEYFLEILTACVAPKKLSTTYHHLKVLSLEIDFANSKVFPTVLCLFRSSPCLQNMTISGRYRGQFRLVTDDEFQSGFPNEEDEFPSGFPSEEEIIFPELKTMTLGEFTGINNELGLVQFILANAVKLHTMDVFWYKDVSFGCRRAHILQRMMQFQRASPTAVVKFLG